MKAKCAWMEHLDGENTDALSFSAEEKRAQQTTQTLADAVVQYYEGQTQKVDQKFSDLWLAITRQAMPQARSDARLWQRLFRWRPRGAFQGALVGVAAGATIMFLVLRMGKPFWSDSGEMNPVVIERLEVNGGTGTVFVIPPGDTKNSKEGHTTVIWVTPETEPLENPSTLENIIPGELERSPENHKSSI